MKYFNCRCQRKWKFYRIIISSFKFSFLIFDDSIKSNDHHQLHYKITWDLSLKALQCYIILKGEITVPKFVSVLPAAVAIAISSKNSTGIPFILN